MNFSVLVQGISVFSLVLSVPCCLHGGDTSLELIPRNYSEYENFKFFFCYVPQELPLTSIYGCPPQVILTKSSPDLSFPQRISNLCGL